MAKKKTRQEKILADHRHKLYHLEPISAQVSLPAQKNIPISYPKQQSVVSYAYVITDVRKTAAVTASILLLQIILFFITRRI